MNRFSAFPAAQNLTPRAVAGAVRAASNPAEIIREMSAGLDQFKARQETRLGQIEAAVDKGLMRGGMASLSLGDGGMPSDPNYSNTFASYMRTGQGAEELRRANAEGFRAQVQAAMSVGTTSDGGYLAPVEWDRQVRSAQMTLSPMRRISSVITTGVGAFSTVWSNDSWGSGWVGETALRPATTTPQLSTLEFASGEIYANVAMTQRLIDDAALDLEQWMAAQVGDEFTKQEGIAFISGNGTNKPNGLLTYVTGGTADGKHPGGNLSVDLTAGSAALVGDDLVAFSYALPAPYRQGANWLMNSTTAAAITKLKDAQGAYVWREGLMAGEPATLLGYPVEIDEGMPAIAASAVPIAFGNFKAGYLINDRQGIRTLRDPYTNKPYVNFYTTKRVGGGLLDPNAIRLLKIKP